MKIPPGHQPILVDLERLNAATTGSCAACNRPFTLGESAVFACGFWGGSQRLIHASEGVFDAAAGQWVERACHSARITERPGI